MELHMGKRIEMKYKGELFEVVIINPHAFGSNKPSIGLGYRMQERRAGITHATLRNWLKMTREENCDDFHETDTVQYLELPQSKKQFAVYHLPFDEADQKSGRGNLLNDYYKVIEASDFIDLCFNALAFEKLSPLTKNKIADFLRWFTIEGFYAQAYAFIKGAYEAADSDALHKWLISRLTQTPERKPYAKFIVDLHQNPAFWTNYTYLYLFGKIAAEMRIEWKTIKGAEQIARNHIPEAVGLEAVGFVERQVPEIYMEKLKEAHDTAICIARHKFKLPIPDSIDEEKLYSGATQKLTPTQISEIQELYQDGYYTQVEIAEAYGVTPKTVAYHCRLLKKDRP